MINMSINLFYNGQIKHRLTNMSINLFYNGQIKHSL